MEMMEMIEKKAKEIINRYFPGYQFSLAGDPEDESVQFIRLYDVEDSEVKAFRSKLWDVIEEHLETQSISFVPSVVSHSNTEKFYSEMLRVPSCASVTDYAYELHEEIMKQLERASTISVNCFEFGEDLIKSDYSSGKEFAYNISKIVAHEDGGCGYAGENCRLAA